MEKQLKTRLVEENFPPGRYLMRIQTIGRCESTSSRENEAAEQIHFVINRLLMLVVINPA